MHPLRKTLQSLMAARHQAARLETRFFEQMTRLASTVPNGAKAAGPISSRRALRRTLKCPKCPRLFARPLHLGRHLSASHGRKRKKTA
jgi:hypothetical protein